MSLWIITPAVLYLAVAAAVFQSARPGGRGRAEPALPMALRSLVWPLPLLLAIRTALGGDR